MKKSVVFLVAVLLAALLSGCIVSATPNGDVIMNAGEQMTFSVTAFPPDATYTWALDGTPLANTGSSYTFTANSGVHALIVREKDALGTDTFAWYITTNTAPVANAGADQVVDVDTTVTLDGTGSTDPDNNIQSYQWQQTDGPSVIVTNADTTTAQFTASVVAGSIMTFALTVTDALGLQATDTCVITVGSPIDVLLNSLVTIPAGSFLMGSSEYSIEQPIHQVTLQSFDIGKYEVTQAQYEAVMSINPSHFQGSSYPDSANRPVEMVDYSEARQFCQMLSSMTGRTFTFPSEAQWEYACRAGTTTRYSFGDLDADLVNHGWSLENSGSQTHPVGTRLPNPWGLYDMHGNVWEWCLDSWHDDYNGAPTDGSAWEPETGSYRVIRGGSWHEETLFCRSASRGRGSSNSNYVGFRVVAVPAGD